MKKIYFLSFILFSIVLNAQQKTEIDYKNNKYNLKINKIYIEDNKCFELTLDYPQEILVVKDTINDKEINLKEIKKYFTCVKDTLLRINNLNEILEKLLSTAISNYYCLKQKTDTVNIYYYNNKKIIFPQNEKVDNNELKIITSKINKTIYNYDILFDLTKEKKIGYFEINNEIPIYKKSKAIPLSFMPLLLKYYEQNKQEFKNDSLLITAVCNKNNNYINYQTLKEIKKQKIIDSNNLKKTNINKKELNKEIRKFSRKLKRLQNISWKENIRYKGNKTDDAMQIGKTKVTNGTITFENSTIKYFNVNTQSDTTYYSTFSIPIKSQASITQNYNVRLYSRYQNYKNRNNFIKVGDVFKYYFKPQNYTDDFSPKDTSVNFTVKDKETVYEVKKQSMSSVFDIRVFSDLTGLFGDKPAGVIQTEAVAHFKLNTNWPRKTSIKFFNYFEPSFNYASFKNEYNSLLINNYNWGTDSIINIDAFNLQRYSNYSSGINVNIVRIGLKRLSSTLDLNIFSNILNTNISYNTVDSTNLIINNVDTTIATSDNLIKKNLYSVSYGVNFLWRTMNLTHFGVDISLKLYGLGLINSGNEYQLVNYTSINKFKEIKSVQKNKLVFFYNPSITLFYRPNSNGHGSMFFRSTYFGCFGNNVNSYLFIQIGYSLSINKLINNKPEH